MLLCFVKQNTADELCISDWSSDVCSSDLLAAGLKRYSVNLLAHYDVSDAFRPFVEAKYVRVDALQEGQPSFFQGSLAGFFATTHEQFDAIPELRCDKDRKSVGSGKSWSVRVDSGGSRIINKKKTKKHLKRE